MTSLFVRLKLRLLRNILRTSQGPGVVAFAILVMILGVSVSIGLRRADDVDRLIAAPVLAGFLLVMWLVAPILFGASDETIDTTRLALFPLDTDAAARGLAVAGLIGPGPIAALVALGGVASRAPDPLSMILAAAAAVVTIALATSNSRLLLTVLGSSLRKRRTRDIATLATGAGVGLLGVASQVLAANGQLFDRANVTRIAEIVRLTPLGWSGDALGRASRGELAVPLLELSASIGLLWLIVKVWGIALARALTEVTEAAEESDIGGGFIGPDPKPGAASPLRVIMAKERRYFARHPRYRLQVVSQFTVLVIGGAPFIGAVLQRNPESVLLGSIPGLTAGITGSNLLGPDGRSLWAEITSMRTLTPLLRGRSLAFAGLGFVGAALITFGAAIWTGGWVFVAPALGCAIGMALTGSGVGSYTSVVAPALYPDEGSPNPFATSTPGSGCITAIYTFIGVGVGLVLVGPILAMLAVARDDASARVVLIAAAPLYGTVIWWFTTRAAGRRADRKSPELITELAKAA